MNDFYLRQESLHLDTDKTIVVIGAGGIGFNLTQYLAMAGVNNIYVFDNDIVEIHNLSRLALPYSCIGKNKATILSSMIKQMRPDSEITGYPFKFNPDVIDLNSIDIIVDCTDIHTVQLENKKIADDNGITYIKAGYNGRHITITQSVEGWDVDDAPDGYTIIPSYISPAAIVASLTVDMILNNNIKEVSCSLDDLMIVR